MDAVEDMVMDAIGPGDWVECVEAPKGGAYSDEGFARVGCIYQVREVIDRCRGNDGVEPGCRLVGQPQIIDDLGLECAYPLALFRPIYRPKSEIIEALKQPAPSVKVDA